MKIYVFIGLLLVVLITFVTPVQASLTVDQISAIVSLLRSFGADQSVINNVEVSLLGTTSGGDSSCTITNIKNSLYLGLSDKGGGNDVEKLQRFLAKDSSVYPEGMITGFFGPLTERAVKRWQSKNGIVSSGSPDTTGYGMVGPKTRLKIKTVCLESGGNNTGDASGTTISLPTDTTPTSTSIATVPTPTATFTLTVPTPTSTFTTTAPDEDASIVGDIVTSPTSGNDTGDTSETTTPPITDEDDTEDASETTNPPIISNIQSTSITETSATITWTTDKSTNSKVSYALSSLSTATSTINTIDSSDVTDHSINLTNLTDVTIYYYIVVSVDANSGTATSSEKSFTTLTSPPIPDQDVIKINTIGWEDTPFISLDGKKLYFTYSPHDYLRAAKSKFKDIAIIGPIREGHTREEYITDPQILVVHNYVATRNSNGTWASPEPIRFEGGDHVGGSMWVSENENTMFLAGWKGGNPNRINYGSGDIYVSSRVSGNDWGATANIGPTINTVFLEDNPHFVESKQTLYFDSDRPGSLGGWDIYYSAKDANGILTSPVNIGAPINTSDTEGMAYFNKAGDEIYFVRGGAKSGASKLYFSKLTNGNWSEPELIDLGIEDLNSPSVTDDGQELFFLVGNNELDVWHTTRKSNGTWNTPQPVD